MDVLSRLTRRPALLCAAAVLATSMAAQVSAEEYAKSYPVSSRAIVRVKADDADVRVITSDAPKVDFKVTYRGYKLGSNLTLDSKADGDRIELTVDTRAGLVIGISDRQVSIEVHMPHNADLDLQTGDGDIEVAGINGDVSLLSGDGKLRLSNLSGKLNLQTSDGGITADNLKGDFRMRTGDGDIEATQLDGKCEISSGDGSVRLTGRFDGLDIRSGDGRVSARAAAGSKMTSPWSIRTGDGPVEVTLPKDFKANLDASTSDGRIKVGMPVTVEGQMDPSRVRGALNGGGPALNIHTGDGSIRIDGT